ncbi:MAG: EAL domain-containing protein [Halomonas sp.]|uniref:EAL domain-containing protein n=1 Tax=Billgrantia tianxiuensis TaxID=2497861 RepID=A0A6I6SP89_9GAMM|nr:MULTISPECIES: EAL domain-containing protein [Halomonas]MCE8034483.1 EAL domain-containing protein [Halomonas sp. MCCC 1A11057]MDX5433710.1 EAL domain-containing protein [Halomonas sp.]QHC50366.1 EAL domain-containing protein [Halomonas tianxiuensis]
MHRCAEKEGHCERCEGPLPFAFTMAFQPIVDLAEARVTTYEALVRGPAGESAGSILAQVTPRLLYRFDQACRIRAIELASQLGMTESLSINFLPNAVYEPMACIQATLAISAQVGWPLERLVFEVTESEQVQDQQHLHSIIEAYRATGFTTALDDFGNGFANLDLLVGLHPDRLKIDRMLVSSCDRDSRRQAILRAIIALGHELGIELIAEGVETREEALWLARSGISLQQGFFYARPGLESLTPGLEPALAALRQAI